MKSIYKAPDIKIFVSNRIDLDSKNIGGSLYIPVRCGAVFDQRHFVDSLGDCLGDNISNRRLTFNEFTVLYWAWKNIKADYVGLCHYRRYMIFPKTRLSSDPYGNVLLNSFDEKTCELCGLLDKKQLENTISQYDLLLAEPYNVGYRNFKNLYEHYEEVPWQHKKDMLLALDVISEICPDYRDSANEYFNGQLFYPCNLFIMRKNILDIYCSWLFEILFRLEELIKPETLQGNERRAVGYLGERLLGVFILDYLKKHPDCKYKITQRALVLNSNQITSNKCKTWVYRIAPENSVIARGMRKIYNMVQMYRR